MHPSLDELINAHGLLTEAARDYLWLHQLHKHSGATEQELKAARSHLLAVVMDSQTIDLQVRR